MAKTKYIPAPCPFCGSTPLVGPNDAERDGDAWAFVQCVNQHCAARPRVESYSSARGAARGYREVAIVLWNRRPQST
jgi:hypothetical protein